jgi:hypothetical protein
MKFISDIIRLDIYFIILQPIGINLKYKIHMTNGAEDDYLHREYSADEFCTYPPLINTPLTAVGSNPTTDFGFSHVRKLSS